MCVKNEHYFCKSCVTQHLQLNQNNCPVCRDKLTVKTLREPGRFFLEVWSELRIKCDYYDRGCFNPVQLGMLEHHVAACNFAGEACSNEGCEMVVNRQDLNYHGCKEVEKEVKKLKEEMRDKLNNICGELNQIKDQNSLVLETLANMTAYFNIMGASLLLKNALSALHEVIGSVKTIFINFVTQL